MFLLWNSPNFATIKSYNKKTIFIIWEINFLSLFIWAWIKFKFSLKSPIAYFLRSLFNSSRKTYLLWTEENKDVSSTKILHVELRPSLKAFIYMKNKIGPRTEPCGSPDFIPFQEELWPCRTTLCWRSWR